MLRRLRAAGVVARQARRPAAAPLPVAPPRPRGAQAEGRDLSTHAPHYHTDHRVGPPQLERHEPRHPLGRHAPLDVPVKRRRLDRLRPAEHWTRPRWWHPQLPPPERPLLSQPFASSRSGSVTPGTTPPRRPARTAPVRAAAPARTTPSTAATGATTAARPGRGTAIAALTRAPAAASPPTTRRPGLPSAATARPVGTTPARPPEPCPTAPPPVPSSTLGATPTPASRACA